MLAQSGLELRGQPRGVAELDPQRLVAEGLAELPQVEAGLHTVKLTAKGIKEYEDPTEARFNVLPFNGGSRTVICQFSAQS